MKSHFSKKQTTSGQINFDLAYIFVQYYDL